MADWLEISSILNISQIGMGLENINLQKKKKLLSSYGILYLNKIEPFLCSLYSCALQYISQCPIKTVC